MPANYPEGILKNKQKKEKNMKKINAKTVGAVYIQDNLIEEN